MAISEGGDLIVDGLQSGRSGRYLLQAAIASLYAEAPSYADTDWQQIVILYDALLIAWPSPVVALNRTVALAMVSGPEVALAEVKRLEHDERLDGYLYLPAIKADLLLRLGRTREAYDAFQIALALAQNDAEREYLSERIADL